MSEIAPQVIVIAGPNGAGKTTLTPFLLRDTLGVLEYVNADPIALGLSGFDPGSMAFEAGRVMLKRLHELGEERRTFAFESTLAGRSYAQWIERLRSDGHKFHLTFLWLRRPDLAVQRVQERVRVGEQASPIKSFAEDMSLGLETSGSSISRWRTDGWYTIIPGWKRH